MRFFVLSISATREPAANPLERILALGERIRVTNHTVLIARDGGERRIDDSVTRIRKGHGEIDGNVLVFPDVTEHKEHDATLLEEARRKGMPCIIPP